MIYDAPKLESYNPKRQSHCRSTGTSVGVMKETGGIGTNEFQATWMRMKNGLLAGASDTDDTDKSQTAEYQKRAKLLVSALIGLQCPGANAAVTRIRTVRIIREFRL